MQEQQAGSASANMLTGGLDQLFTRADSSCSCSAISDAVGSTVALTNSAGTVQTEYSYEPFGKTSASGTSSSNATKYTGREDDQTGLYFYRARYYSPQLQRFISEDPIGLAGGVNLYAYVGNNPISFRDPFGLEKNRGASMGSQSEFPDPNNPPSDWTPQGPDVWRAPDGDTWHWHPDPDGRHGGDHWDIGKPRPPGGGKGDQEWWPRGGQRGPKPSGKDRIKPVVPTHPYIPMPNPLQRETQLERELLAESQRRHEVAVYTVIIGGVAIITVLTGGAGAVLVPVIP